MSCPIACPGRTGRAGNTGRATSFYTDRDSFLVSQIKRAIQELESGNASAFATGKAARQKEKEVTHCSLDGWSRPAVGWTMVVLSSLGPGMVPWCCCCCAQAAVEFKEKLAIGPSNVVDTAGAAVKVANKYSYMANAKTETVGAADGERFCVFKSMCCDLCIPNCDRCWSYRDAQRRHEARIIATCWSDLHSLVRRVDAWDD